MKRLFSLMIIWTLIIGLLPWAPSDTAFSAAEKSSADLLGQWKLIEGSPGGSYNETGKLTRAEMMVILAKLSDEYDQAKFYTGSAYFKDVKLTSWYYPYVAYAQFKRWSSGDGKGNFKPESSLTYDEALVFMLKALGYSVPNYKAVRTQATKLGIDVDTTIGPERPLIRGELFDLMISTLKVNKNGDYQTLASSIGIQFEAPTAGTYKGIELESAKSINQKIVAVITREPVTAASLPTFKVSPLSGSGLVTLVNAEKMGDREVWLTVSGLTVGSGYAIDSKNTVKFTQVAADTIAPEVRRLTPISATELVVEFSEDMDSKTALDVASYQIGGGVSVKGAAFVMTPEGMPKRWMVKLTTSSQTASLYYTIKFSKALTDLSGLALNLPDLKALTGFTSPAADTTGPKLLRAVAKDANTIQLSFDEASNLDIISAEALATYSLVNKTNTASAITIMSATLVQSPTGNYGDVVLKTTALTPQNQYEIRVSTLLDEFNNQISNQEAFSSLFSFTGVGNDLKISMVQSVSSTRLKVTFNQEVAKDKALSLQYSINNNLKINLLEYDPYSSNVAYLTTDPQSTGRSYSLTVAASKFESGKYTKMADLRFDFTGNLIDMTRPKVKLIEMTTYNKETVVAVTFTKAIDMTTALDVKKYTLSNDMGQPLEVLYGSATMVYLRTKPLKDNILYALTVGNVVDVTGSVVENDVARQTFSGRTEAASLEPKVLSAFAVDNRTITVVFNKPMKTLGMTAPYTKDAVYSGFAVDPDNYQITDLASKTVYIPKYAATNADQTEVSLRFETAILSGSGSYKLSCNANGTDGLDNDLTAIQDKSGAKLPVAKATYTFTGSDTAVSRPGLAVIKAVSTSEIQLLFSDTVSIFGYLDGGDIGVSLPNGTTYLPSPSNCAVLPGANNTMQIRFITKMPMGATVKVSINNFSRMRDQFGDLSVDPKMSLNYVNVQVPAVDNRGPVATAVESQAGALVIQYDRPVDQADRYDYRIKTNRFEELPVAAEYDNNDRSRVKLYYAYENITGGNTYTVSVGKGAVKDVVGAMNESEFILQFVGTGGKVESPVFAMAQALSQNVVALGFSQPVSNMYGPTLSSAFKIAGMPGDTVYTIDKAFNGDKEIELDNGMIPMGKFFTIVHVRVNKVMYWGVEQTVGLNPAMATLQNLYTKTVDMESTQRFTGIYDIEKVKLASGWIITSGGAGLINVKADTASTELAAVTYSKYLFLKAYNSDGIYNSAQDVVNAFNSADVTTALNRGTELEKGVVGGKTYDVLIILLDSSNNVTGYFIQKSLSVQ